MELKYKYPASVVVFMPTPIAPLWNWNFFATLAVSASIFSNRTFMELKYAVLTLMMLSIYSPIAPLWNWNDKVIFDPILAASSNRTFMELKWRKMKESNGKITLQSHLYGIEITLGKLKPVA